MVKGISRQVIVVQSPDTKLFEQAIFILKEDAHCHGVTDEVLLKEAERAARQGARERKWWYSGGLWACGGAAVTGFVWLLVSFL